VKLARAAHHARAGLTLVEVMIAALMLVIFLGGIGIATKSSTSSFRQSNTESTLEASSHRALNRIVDELAYAERDALSPEPDPPLGSSSLEFHVCQGATGDVVDWGPLTRIEFALEAGEVDDGLDNNGNGLVDEGIVLRTLDVGGANERSVVLCHDVRELADDEQLDDDDDNGNGLNDEAGLAFSVEGDVLTVRLCLERLDPHQRPITKTVTTSVRVRN
jgi:hypothetical protein